MEPALDLVAFLACSLVLAWFFSNPRASWLRRLRLGEKSFLTLWY